MTLRAAILAPIGIITCFQANAATVSIDDRAFGPFAVIVDFESDRPQIVPDVDGAKFLQEVFPSNYFGTVGPGLFELKAFTNIVVDPFGSPRFTNLAVEFAAPRGQVGAWIGNIQNFLGANPGSITVSVYDMHHNVLSEVNVALKGTEGPHPFVGFQSDEGIQRIEWSGANVGFFAIDNLMFSQPTVIPVPTALPLFVTALVATGLSRRRVCGQGAV